jgi:hypothetical protein
MTFLLSSLASCWLAGIVFLVRNNMVCAARIAVIDLPDFPRSYHRLPSYDAMLLHPKYMLLWTSKHWLAWLERSHG